ncbi:MAG: 50S ribosomal protein L22 [Patescibacteria group bacterium]
MDKVVAKLKYLRVAPKKVRQVARLLKGMSFVEAESQLKFLPQKSVKPLYKLLISAGANAENNYNLSRADLFVENILVDPGPTLKRMRARARGMAAPIRKRSSHITLFLSPIRGKQLKRVAKKQSLKMKKPKKSAIRSEKAGSPPRRPMKKERLAKASGVKQKVFRRKAI